MEIEKQYNNIDSHKIDPLTGEEFTPKRTNQRFASRENQVAYNNAKASDIRRVKAPKLKALDNNFKVLTKLLNGNNLKEVSTDFLLGAGFDFHSSSSLDRIGDKIYQGVYDLRITKVEDNLYEISKS